MEYRTHYRSFFWPILLIGVGAIWLLNNLGYLDAGNLAQLWRLWPLLLIAAGFDLLIGRRTPAVGAMMGVVVVALVGFFLVSGYQLPGATNPQVSTDYLRLPIEQAKSAQVNLDFWSDPVKVYALKGSDQLIDATVVHVGQINFSGSGQSEKIVHLSRNDTVNIIYPWFTGQNLHADVGLSPNVPLDLTVNTGSGSSNLNLAGLQLSHLNLDSGSGSIDVTLPKSTQAYDARLNTGSGSADVTIQDGAGLNLTLNTGSGSVNVRIPSGAAVRIDVRSAGSGSVHVPSSLVRTVQRGNKAGTWESPNFASAQNQITITASFGSGSMNFNY